MHPAGPAGPAGPRAGAGARELTDRAWPAVADLPTHTVLAVPLGSIEQHGPHLPLSTDTTVALALCRGLAERRTDVVVAPALPYGSSGEHDGFAGTLSIGQAALELVLLELVRSATASFAHVLLVSGHGGNAEPAARAVTTLRAEGRDVLLHLPRWRGDPHAGHVETSVQLVLDPDHVDLDRAVAGETRPLAQILPQLRAGGVRSVSASGVLGDPTTANADDGARLLAGLLDDLAGAVSTWRRRDVDREADTDTNETQETQETQGVPR